MTTEEHRLHSEFRAAIQVLQDSYDHGHPDDLAKCPGAFETLEGLVEQYEIATHRCVYPACVDGEKPSRCGSCGDALRAEAAEASIAYLKEQLEALREALDLIHNWSKPANGASDFSVRLQIESIARAALTSNPASKPEET